MVKIFFGFFACLIILTGCFNLGGVFTLKRYSSSQAALAKEVAEANARFAQLEEDYKSGIIKIGDKKDNILRRYGGPILCADVHHEGKPVKRFLYRRQSAYFGAHKIYMYFDAEGTLVSLKDANGGSSVTN